MTLLEKINSIPEPKIKDTIGLLPEIEDAVTIKEFFDKFVKDKLPSEDIIKKWHELLVEYTTDLTNVSCCVRYGNRAEKNVVNGETGYYKLRRGWLTKNTNDNFEYFFADNFFSSFVYKMAIDEFVPDSVDELRDVFVQHKFPYGFGYFVDKKTNEYKGVVVETGKQPGFLGNYKLSHVFDSGKRFLIDGKIYDDTYLSEKYFPIGNSNDYLKENDKIRKMQITDEAKKVIVAKFWRFVHPFNYFVTPSKTHHLCGEKVANNDIGEEPEMINYVKMYLQNTYPIIYKEFCEHALWPDDPTIPVIANGNKIINIKYGRSVNNKNSNNNVRVKTTDEFSEFVNYLNNMKFKSFSTYKNFLRYIMKEKGISNVDELKLRIDEVIDYCTIQKDKAKNDEKLKKRYNDIRSACKKFKEYCETNNVVHP